MITLICSGGNWAYDNTILYTYAQRPGSAQEDTTWRIHTNGRYMYHRTLGLGFRAISTSLGVLHQGRRVVHHVLWRADVSLQSLSSGQNQGVCRIYIYIHMHIYIYIYIYIYIWHVAYKETICCPNSKKPCLSKPKKKTTKKHWVFRPIFAHTEVWRRLLVASRGTPRVFLGGCKNYPIYVGIMIVLGNVSESCFKSQYIYIYIYLFFWGTSRCLILGF